MSTRRSCSHSAPLRGTSLPLLAAQGGVRLVRPRVGIVAGMIYEAAGTSVERTRRILVKSTAVTASVSLLSMVLFAAVTRLDIGTMIRSPERLATVGAEMADLVRLWAVVDLVGYYLLFGIVVLAVRGLFWLRGAKRMNLLAASGIAYILVGGFGALLFAANAPSLIADVTAVGGASRAVAVRAFADLTDLVFGFLWQRVATIPAGLWWIGIALLVGKTLPVLRSLAGLTGALALLTAVVAWLGIEVVADVLAAVWVVVWIPAVFVLGWSFRGVAFDAPPKAPVLGSSNDHDSE